MPQVLVTQPIEGLHGRSYRQGSVVSFTDTALIDWLKGRKQVDDTWSVVTAALAAGSPVLVHGTALVSNPRTNDSVRTSSQTFAQLFLGQSPLRGSARTWGGPGTLAQAVTFVGRRYRDPVAPAVSRLGSIYPFLDEIYRAAGYDAQLYNCAIGSLSLIKHVAGQVRVWAANTTYYGSRVSVGGGDRGDYGDVVNIGGGRLVRAKIARQRYAFYDDATTAVPGVGLNRFDYIQTTATAGPGNTASTGISGATVPDWSTLVNLGDTKVDGTVTWELVMTAGAPAALAVLVGGQLGFDPLGVLQRLKAIGDAITNVPTGSKRVYLSNAQSDAQGIQSDQANVKAWYKAALISIINVLLAWGFKVDLGLDGWNPGFAIFNDGTDLFTALHTAREEVLAQYAISNPNDVKPGVNFYGLWGRTVKSYPEPPDTAQNGINMAHSLAEEHEPMAMAVARATLTALGAV